MAAGHDRPGHVRGTRRANHRDARTGRQRAVGKADRRAPELVANAGSAETPLRSRHAVTKPLVSLLAACVQSWSCSVQTTPNPTAVSLRQDTSHTTRIETGRAFVNGIHIYYEVNGSHDGIPLVLLHGGGSTIDSNFGRVLPFLANTRRGIALEEQGHGRTSDRDQPFTFEGSADDVAGLLRHLNVSQADLLGFSNGASVALQVAIRHPRLVRKLGVPSSLPQRE